MVMSGDDAPHHARSPRHVTLPLPTAREGRGQLGHGMHVGAGAGLNSAQLQAQREVLPGAPEAPEETSSFWTLPPCWSHPEEPHVPGRPGEEKPGRGGPPPAIHSQNTPGSPEVAPAWCASCGRVWPHGAGSRLEGHRPPGSAPGRPVGTWEGGTHFPLSLRLR